MASIKRGWNMVLRWPTSGERWWQAVSADFAAMVASASRVWCVRGERKRLACRTGVVAWCARRPAGDRGNLPSPFL
jgi:hypothetical protein